MSGNAVKEFREISFLGVFMVEKVLSTFEILHYLIIKRKELAFKYPIIIGIYVFNPLCNNKVLFS